MSLWRCTTALMPDRWRPTIGSTITSRAEAEFLARCATLSTCWAFLRALCRSKERLEIFGGGAVAVLDDFRRLELVRNGHKKVIRSWLRRDKGHRAEWVALSSAIRGGSESPIPFPEIVATTLTTLRAVESRSSGQPAYVDLQDFLNSQLRQVPSC